ncbi:MAG: glycosyltransferase family 2 protein [Pseudohongiella sp.]|jgi:GT2 family glycosyltransferase|nr:glycosyltransferase family 2 protein [Pseudohongiella sp.]
MSSPAPLPCLTVSVVVYHLDVPVVSRALNSLQTAADQAGERGLIGSLHIHLIDNAESPENRHVLADLLKELPPPLIPHTRSFKSGHGNIGFGRAHNLVITSTSADAHDYYLVLNPDVFLAPDSLVEGLSWLAAHPPSVAVAPAIQNGDGNKVSACKRFPSVLDFLLRGFAPARVKALFRKRLDRYEMTDLPQDQASNDIPVISGCFMLFRHQPLQALQGFDPGYFLYFEDFDLAIRAHQSGTLTYLPSMNITHLGGHSARKGLRHILMFGRSAWRFFNTHGWRWI